MSTELYGFDILVDSDLKPWLLEVNLSPSLGCDTPLDTRVKSALLADLLTLVGLPAVDPVVRPQTQSRRNRDVENKRDLTMVSQISMLKQNLIFVNKAKGGPNANWFEIT